MHLVKLRMMRDSATTIVWLRSFCTCHWSDWFLGCFLQSFWSDEKNGPSDSALASWHGLGCVLAVRKCWVLGEILHSFFFGGGMGGGRGERKNNKLQQQQQLETTTNNTNKCNNKKTSVDAQPPASPALKDLHTSFWESRHTDCNKINCEIQHPVA